jgi:hypothetical protein
VASAWEGKWLQPEDVESANPQRKNYFWLWVIPFTPILFMLIKNILFG